MEQGPILSVEERSAILDEAIAKYARSGYTFAHRTPATAQLIQRKKFSFVWAVFWFLLFGIGVLIYLFYYWAKRDKSVYLRVDALGRVATDAYAPFLLGRFLLALLVVVSLLVLGFLVLLMRQGTPENINQVKTASGPSPSAPAVPGQQKPQQAPSPAPAPAPVTAQATPPSPPPAPAAQAGVPAGYVLEDCQQGTGATGKTIYFRPPVPNGSETTAPFPANVDFYLCVHRPGQGPTIPVGPNLQVDIARGLGNPNTYCAFSEVDKNIGCALTPITSKDLMEPS